MDKVFAKFASATAKAAGTPIAFLVCLVSVIAWAATGPIFKYSENWQLVINTGTTIVTFLMVFLIQNSQNRDGAAIQTKLDELIRASDAENAFMGIETLTDKELDHMHARCQQTAEETRRNLEKFERERKARRTKAGASAKASAAKTPAKTSAKSSATRAPKTA
jgi:low affinity Fe/Cu permease